MAANFKKAGSVIRNSFRTKRYVIFDAEENNYILTPQKKCSHGQRRRDGGDHLTTTFRSRPRSVSTAASGDENENLSTLANANTSVPKHSQSKLKKGGASMTQSVRVAVGTLRQRVDITLTALHHGVNANPFFQSSLAEDNNKKLKLSMRRGHLQVTPKRAGTRQSTVKSQEVHLYSPFKIDTPKMAVGKHVQTCHSLETPTRLRREVEALTVNMQALSALTPNTLQGRSRARKSLTNGRLRSPRSTCKRIVL